MSDQQLRVENKRATWMIIAVCLAPLVPYAMHGMG